MKIRRYLCRQLLGTCLMGVLLIVTHKSFGQDTTKTIPDGTEGERLEVIYSSAKKKSWNTLNRGFTRFKIGVAFLYEYAGFSQDETGKRQMDSAKVSLESGFGTRDFRFLFSGKFKTKRNITWKAGLMYDGSLDSWFLRESGNMGGGARGGAVLAEEAEDDKGKPGDGTTKLIGQGMEYMFCKNNCQTKLRKPCDRRPCKTA